MKQRLFSLCKQGAVVALSVLFISGAGYVFAQPTVSPDGTAGVALPINTGSSTQVKSGALTVNGTLTAGGALNVSGTLSVPTICLNGDCQSSWPSGGFLQSGSGMAISNWTGAANGGGSYNNCQNYKLYYSNGRLWQNYGYCANNTPISIQITAPGQVVSTFNEKMRCVYDYGTYTNAPSYYFQDNGYSHPYYTDMVNVNINVSGSTITVSGECPANYNLSYVIGAASITYLYQ